MLYQQRQIRQAVFRRFQRSGSLLVAVLKLRNFLLQIRIAGNIMLVEKYHCTGSAFQIFNFCPAFIACGLLSLDAVFNVDQQRYAAALKTEEHRLFDLALLIKHTATYKELKPLYSEYKKSRDKEKYLRGREREIILFEASARALKAAGVGDKLPDLAKLREEYSRLSEEKDRLYAEYGSLKKRMREYDAVKQNIDSILSPNRGQEQDKAL